MRIQNRPFRLTQGTGWEATSLGILQFYSYPERRWGRARLSSPGRGRRSVSMGTGCKRSVRRGSPSLPAAIMMLGRGLDARDNQTRQVREAVSNVEKHFGELCQIFAAYVRKTARLRDKADLLVNEIYAYAATETPSLKLGLKNFADEFSKLQDYRQAEDDLKATLTAKNREAKQLSQLERTRQRNPSDRHIISQAESDLQRASMDATRTSRQLEETIDNFEKQKIKDIKSIFSEFITIEMLFHGKALEIYTAAYQNIHNIDENEDLEVFRSSLYPPDYQSRLDIVRANSKSPLQRTGSSKFSSGIIQQISTSRLRKEEEDEEEEEEDDDDELEATKEEREL
ncbi:protein FAM92A isoform X4 [Mauremys reevesii]|uniref:protein FAM92A isoform X4 n=1 Tax=Mauremys reevesii TaxID=260615 RepID=UPI00193F2035|nr:protein FAM92A isoform X4 [Mauremys reevesii]